MSPALGSHGDRRHVQWLTDTVARTVVAPRSVIRQQKGPNYGAFDGRYWARTSDPQLVVLVLKGRFAGSFSAVGKYLGNSHN
jgi:hypothetical protein